MNKRLSRALTALKEHGSVSYAKMVTMAGFGDMYCIITKATSPDDSLLSDKYINQILKIFSLSLSSSFRSFSLGFSRRFMKTRCWRVALKCLILLHRLLLSLPLNSSFRGDIIWARTKGLLCLNPCTFVDRYSSSFSEDYALFIRSYASLLDEALDCYSIYVESWEIAQHSLEEKMKESGPKPNALIELLPQLQSLIDRVLECEPTPVAIQNNLVQSALKLIIDDSFKYYMCFRSELVPVFDSLLQLPYRSCIFAFNIYKKAAVQTDQISEFYNWCKYMGIIFEYPCIDKIPEVQVIEVEKLVSGMWELTESQSLSSSTSSPLMGSCWSLTEDGSEKNMQCFKTKINSVWEKFDDDLSISKAKNGFEMEPLIQFDEVEDNANWEAILEASLTPSYQGFGDRYGHIYNSEKYPNGKKKEETNEWKMQVYNHDLGSNHVYHGHNISQHCEALSSNPVYPWGL